MGVGSSCRACSRDTRRKRLFLVSPLDGSRQTLTEKLLARPRLLAHIRSLISDPDLAHLVPYNTMPLELVKGMLGRLPRGGRSAVPETLEILAAEAATVTAAAGEPAAT